MDNTQAGDVTYFASKEDYKKWRADLRVYGNAVIDQDGKHIPIKNIKHALA